MPQIGTDEQGRETYDNIDDALRAAYERSKYTGPNVFEFEEALAKKWDKELRASHGKYPHIDELSKLARESSPWVDAPPGKVTRSATVGEARKIDKSILDAFDEEAARVEP